MKRGDLVDGRFEIDALAGEGGMGMVFTALDRTTGERVALKLLHTLHPKAIARFEREARVLASLAHPIIVRYIAHGAHGEQRYLVTQWIEGEELHERLARGRLGIEESVSLCQKLAEGLGAAHARGVVHRDVKPRNILLERGALEAPRLIDFGIARAEGEVELTSTGAFLGTPGYLAPEQARGVREIDARADVFALGAVLFRCLTGERPFEGDDAASLMMEMLRGSARRARTLRPEIPSKLDELVAVMLDLDPAFRPADGTALASRMGDLLAKGFAAPDASATIDTAAFADTDVGNTLLDRLRAASPPESSALVEKDADASVETTVRKPSETSAPDRTLLSEMAKSNTPGIVTPAPHLPSRPGERRKWPLIGLAAASIAAVVVGARFLPSSASLSGVKAPSNVPAPSSSDSPGSAISTLATTLAIDCRAPENEHSPACGRPSALDPGAAGSGPPLSMLAPSGHIFGGIFFASQIVVGLGWGDEKPEGLVAAIDPGTGKRTVVSGQYDQLGVTMTRGAGTPLQWVHDVGIRAGTEGDIHGPLFAFTGRLGGGARLLQGDAGEIVVTEPAKREPFRIVAIDPQSGDRTIVWESAHPDFGHCTKTDGKGKAREVLPVSQALAIGPDGTFYLALDDNPNGVGRAILAIARDGKTCAAVSAWKSSNHSEDRGSGPTSVSKIRSLRWVGDALYALAWFGPTLVRIDPASGDRTIVSASGKEAVGGGPDLGHEWLAAGDRGGAFWTVGPVTTARAGPKPIVRVDVASGMRVALPALVGPVSLGTQEATGGVWPIEGTRNLAVVVDKAFVMLDPETGNSFTLSN